MRYLTHTLVAGLALAVGAVTPAHAVELDQGAAGTCNNLTALGTSAVNASTFALSSTCNPIPIQYDGIARNLTVRVNDQNGVFNCRVAGYDDSNNNVFNFTGIVTATGPGAPVNALSIPLNVFFVSVTCDVPGKATSSSPASSILGFEISE